MARPRRIQFEGATYHVTSRGNNRQRIFLDDRDRYNLLELLGDAVARFNLQVFAFCFMSNHYHILLRTPESNLNSAFHWVNTVFSMRFNRRHHCTGHLFQGRYHSVLVTDDAHWLTLSMYIHLNPVRAGIVDDPDLYEWSSFRDYTRINSRFDWLRRNEIIARYGATPDSQRNRYRHECLLLGKGKPEFMEKINSGVLGSHEVVEKVARKLQPSEDEGSKPYFSKAMRPEVDIMREVARVAEFFGVRVEEIMRKRRNFPPRLALYYHLITNCGIKVSHTASKLSVSTGALSKGINSLKEMITKDEDLKSKLESLNNQLINSKPDPELMS